MGTILQNNEWGRNMTQSIKVLHRDEESHEGDPQRFTAADEDSGEVWTTLLLPFADWDDMGRIKTVTVTIIPGDALNPAGNE